MFIPNYLYQEHDRPFTDFLISLPQITETESGFIVEEVLTSGNQCEDISIDYSQGNSFFKGVLYALPVSLLFWVFLIWAIRELWINFGGGSSGTG